MITIKELRKLFKQAKKEGVPSNAIILIDVNKTDKQINRGKINHPPNYITRFQDAYAGIKLRLESTAH